MRKGDCFTFGNIQLKSVFLAPIVETIQFKLEIVMILRILYAFEHFDVISELDDVNIEVALQAGLNRW